MYNKNYNEKNQFATSKMTFLENRLFNTNSLFMNMYKNNN